MAQTVAKDVDPTFNNQDGTKLNYPIVFGDGNSATQPVVINATKNYVVKVLGELPSADPILATSTVARNIWSRLLVSKAQTNDVSLFGLVGQIKPNATGTDSHSGTVAGVFAYLEEAAASAVTNASSTMCALRAKVEGTANMTAANMYGIHIDSAYASGATLTNFAAIKINTDIEGATGKKVWDSLIDVAGAGTPAVAVMRLISVSGIVARTGSVSNQAGAIKVLVDGNTHYIPFYTTFT